MKRNLEVDRLRAIAALIVIIGHIKIVYFPEAIGNFNGFGITIIDLFFVISGFAISSVLVKQIDQLKAEPARLVAHLKAFAVKRFFRIYPLMYTGFLIVFILSFIFYQSGTFSTPFNNMQAALMLLTSTYNFFFIDRFATLALSPFWSFTIEEQFYITFPLFLLLTSNNRQRLYLCIAALLALTFVIRPITIYYYGFVGLFFTQTHADAIIYGYLIYLLSQQPWFEGLKPQRQRRSWMRIAFVALAFYTLIGVTTLDITPSIYLPISCLVSFMLVLAGVFEKNIIAFPFALQKTLDILAPRSLTLYIIHFPVILLIDSLFQTYLITTPSTAIEKSIVAFLLTLAASEALFRWVVIPASTTSRRIASNIIANNQAEDLTTESLLPDRSLAYTMQPPSSSHSS